MPKSTPLNCIIVDDETSSQRVLEHFIEKTDVLHILSICNNTQEAFAYIQLHQNVDVLFLDINMPKQSGLDFYKSLQHPPKVIFTTAYPQYAVEGFDVSAVDYLLKPIAYERFLVAVNKLLNSSRNEKMDDDFIILKENKALHKVSFKDIIYIEAFGDYVKVHTTNKMITTHSTFSKFINKLPEYFLRTHKSFSINLNRMQHLSGNQIVVDEQTIPIGKTFKDSVYKALNL